MIFEELWREMLPRVASIMLADRVLLAARFP
jgi:hypothetical protein